MSLVSRRLMLTGLLAGAVLTLPLLPVSAQEKSREKDERKPQSEVATKAKFATVKADSAEVKKALEAKDLAGAKKLLGKDGAFTGTVTKVFAPDSNSVVILNFAKSYKDALTAPVRGRDFKKFPDLKQLEGKKVLISGKFEDYKGQLEILLTDPKQVKVIE